MCVCVCVCVCLCVWSWLRELSCINFSLVTDPSIFPKKNRQVQGVALLWQPEVVFPYLATLDLYCGCADTLEAAAGTIQNITACSWKVCIML